MTWEWKNLDEMVRPLVREALLSIRPYVPGRPIQDVMREFGLARVIKMASNENPLGPSPKAVAAIQAMLGELHRYPDGAAQDLRSAIAMHTGLPRDAVFVGNGSDEVIKLVAETFLEPGDEMLAPYPSFSQYDFSAHVMGATLAPVALAEGFAYELGEMRKHIRANTKLVVLCTPNNPTGTWLTHTEVAEFVDSLPSNVIIVLDEAYNEYVDAPDPVRSVELIQAGYAVLSLRTFSKMYGLAGMRLGYALGNPSLIRYLHQARAPFNVNAMAQAAAIAALTDTDHVARSRASNLAGKEQLYRGLERLRVAYVPTQGNFLIARVGDGERVFQSLQEKGVIVRAGFLGLSEYVRVSIGTAEENEQFLKTLADVLGKTADLR